MATIAVRVGREIKEISGLTNRTTCWDVVLALLKEKQLTQGLELNGNSAAEKSANGGQGADESGSNSSASKSVKELAQLYVIVENWRGCEKPIPPRTRILNVWQAWGKEQRHVVLSLKKSKHIRYREGGRVSSPSGDHMASQEEGNVTPTHYNLNKLSQHQKRRIRRNLMQYQRAVMMRRTEDDIDSDDQRNIENNKRSECRILFNDLNKNKNSNDETKLSNKRNGLILSEEQFVDGVLADPEFISRRTDRAELISQGTFNREYCKYRRRNHRRLSSVDGVVDSRPRRRHVSHYPYSPHNRRRRSSSRRHRRTRSKNNRHGSRYSTDDTTSTTTTTTTNTSEDENADDADDEKSILTEFVCTIPRRAHPYSVGGLGGCNYSSSGTTSTTTATDSSTTTSGDSMTSSNGCSTSSETSSGGDYSLYELASRGYFPKKVTFTAADNENNKTVKSSDTKQKKNKSLISFPKPALNLFESFRRTNLKRTFKSTKKSTNNQTQNQPKQEPAAPQITDNARVCDNKPSECKPKHTEDIKECIGNEKPERSEINAVIDSENVLDTKEKIVSEETKNQEQNEFTTNEVKDDDEFEQLRQLVISQELSLKNQQNRLTDIDGEVEKIENDIHQLRTRALGENYVQDAYLSGLMDSESNSVLALNTLLSAPSSHHVATPWILECKDAEKLENFIKECEKLVDMQMKIEQYQRKSELVLQEMQEEVWRVSTDPFARNGQTFGPASAAAAFMLGVLNDEEEDVSDDETRHEALSVTNCEEDSNKKQITNEKKSTVESNDDLNKAKSDCDANEKKGSAKPHPLELEKSRTELEASLYLSLRLNAELEEVDHKLTTSEHLIQVKGENMITCVRTLAMSEEGIHPEIWEEYGELLTAYDTELQQRKYLDLLEAAHLAELEAEVQWEGETTHKNTEYIDATSPNPTSHRINENGKRVSLNAMLTSTPSADPSENHHALKHHTPNSSSAIHHALTPWIWCDHCKMEENIFQSKNRSEHPGQMKDSHKYHQHYLPPSQQKNNHCHQQPPACFSDLPLPRPLDTDRSSTPVSNNDVIRKTGLPHTATITPTLLPMLPLPDGLMSSPRYNDSDYEDLPDMANGYSRNRDDKKDVSENLLTKDHPSFRTKGLLPNILSANARAECTNNNNDDSGNASAGSTTSFTSSDGSRNSSCDGGSPRPLPNTSENGQSSNSFFGRNGPKRSSRKGHFVFPITSKQSNNSQQLSSTQTGKPSHQKSIPPPPPPKSAKPTLKRPELPPKPESAVSQNNKVGIKELSEHEVLLQQQKLIRRNSGGRRKNHGVNQKTILPNGQPSQNCDRQPNCSQLDSRFAPRGGSFKANMGQRINGMLCRPIENNSHCGIKSQTTHEQSKSHFGVAQKRSLSNMQQDHTTRLNSNYDNDSDTGLSSLHSTDSDQVIFSETLV